MKTLLRSVFTLLLVAVQAVLLHFVGGGAFSLALPLAVVVYLGLEAENVEGLLGAAVVGYLMDASAGGPRGLLVFLAVVVFLLARLAGATVHLGGRRGFALLTGALTLVFALGAFLFARSVSPPEAAPGARLLGRILVEAILTGAASPAVMWAMERIDGLFVKDEPGLLR
jgi:rod shape-determining protein MreD